MRKEDGGAEGDRRRFAFQKAGELWMSDVMHGPTVVVGGKVRRKSYLIAFIDDATRVVPFAVFALSENTAAFLPALKQAVMRRGVPEAALRRQRRCLPQPPPVARLREAGHHPHPRPRVPAGVEG
jgi:transposase InsO family protein